MYLKIISTEIYMIIIICVVEYSLLNKLQAFLSCPLRRFRMIHIVRFYFRPSSRLCGPGRWGKWKSHLRRLVEKTLVLPPLKPEKLLCLLCHLLLDHRMQLSLLLSTDHSTDRTLKHGTQVLTRLWFSKLTEQKSARCLTIGRSPLSQRRLC